MKRDFRYNYGISDGLLENFLFLQRIQVVAEITKLLCVEKCRGQDGIYARRGI